MVDSVLPFGKRICLASNLFTPASVFLIGIALLAAVGWFSTRKWLALSQQLVRYEESPQHAPLPETNHVRTAQQGDLVGVGLAMLTSFILVFFFDTGSVADWIAKHKESKVDEVIVTGVILLVGLLFFLSEDGWY